jgi:hypothetical protein
MVSAIEIQGLLWKKMPAFSLYPGGYLETSPRFQPVGGVGGLKENPPVFGAENPLDAFQGILRLSVIQTNACLDAHSLGFDAYLSLNACSASDWLAECVIGPAEPAGAKDCILHYRGFFSGPFPLISAVRPAAYVCVIFCVRANIPDMNTLSAFPLSKLEAVWNDSPGSL